MEHLLEPFDFLKLRHTQLRSYAIVSALSSVTWGIVNILNVLLVGNTLNFFRDGGALSAMVSVFSVMVGVYFGLAGVFATSRSSWLDQSMPGGMYGIDSNIAISRRDFFLLLLVYCAATATILVFAGAIVPTIIPLGVALLDYAAASGFLYCHAVRYGASVLVSMLFVFACTHLLLASLLSFRFLRRAGP